MSGTEHDALTDPASRIADGKAIDWQAELEASPEHEAGLVGLQRVAAIAQAWRDLGVTPQDDDAPASGEAALFRWGALEVREKLGEGSFGEVYRAYEPALAREVALKLRRASGDDASARRALDEARRLARLRHRNVVAVYGADVHEGRAGLWTELLRGRTLEQLIAERGNLGGEEAALIGVDLCGALAAVHAAGFVHGDVKPANVMREDGGRIVLMDFGSGSSRALGVGGALTGTPLTAAPEVLSGAAASVSSDLYSLGALLYRMVTGRYPIQAGTLDELRAKHARGERGSLRTARPDLSPAFVAAVERALAADPAQRFADAGQFESALRSALALSPAPASTTTQSSSSATRGFHWQPWATAAALAIAAFAAWRLQPGTGTQPSDPALVATDSLATPQLAARPVQDVVVPSSSRTSSAISATPITAEAVLYRLRGGERVPLADGSSISPGDHLYLELEAAERLHVYVLDEDEQGETFALFPVPGTEQLNPLAPDQRHRLPGKRDGAPFDWVVTSSGGRDHVLVIASRKPLPELEQRISALAPADAGRPVAYARIGDEAIATLRGIGGMAPAPEGAARESQLDGLARALAARREGGIWVRTFSLQNR